MALKRSEMIRKTPLARGTVPLRRTRLRQVSPKRQAAPKKSKRTRMAAAVSAKTRAVLLARSWGMCEIALPGCLRFGTEPAHRLARKAGGRRGAAKVACDRASNNLWACRACHNWSEARPRESYDLGLMIREGQDSAVEPVVYRGALSLLGDDGSVVPFEAVAAA